MTAGVRDLFQRMKGTGAVSLATHLVDGQMFDERLADQGDDDELTRSIREHGQLVPIQVRPHPSARGRYQLVYGRRRLNAVASLGREVWALVKAYDDREVVFAQTQENLNRTGFSYIERCRFAAAFEAGGMSRTDIMSALGVDRPAVSRMIQVASAVPDEIVVAIGRAPGAGRTRWLTLARTLAQAGALARVAEFVTTETFRDPSSDQRFSRLLDHIGDKTSKRPVAKPLKAGGIMFATITDGELRWDEAKFPGLGALIAAATQAACREWLERPKDNEGPPPAPRLRSA